MDPQTARRMRELPPSAFQALVDYAAARCWAIAETYGRTIGKLPGGVLVSFVDTFEKELFSTTYLIGLGRLYHLGSIDPPVVVQKLANIHSFGQIRDAASISEFVAGERGSANPPALRHEGDWWTQYEGPLRQIVAHPIATPAKVFQWWQEYQREGRPETHQSGPSPPDSLRLLSLSRDDLHVTFRMSEQLMQEAAMEAISTLKYLKDVDESVATLDRILEALDLVESSEDVRIPGAMRR